MSAGERRAYERRTGKIGAGEIDARKVNIRKDGAGQICVRQVGPEKIDARELRLSEIRTFEIAPLAALFAVLDRVVLRPVVGVGVGRSRQHHKPGGQKQYLTFHGRCSFGCRRTEPYEGLVSITIIWI